MQENTKNQLIIGATRIVWVIVIVLMSIEDMSAGIIFAIIAGAMDAIIISEFRESDKLTVYDRILSYGNNCLGKTMTFETLADNFEGLYTKRELAEAIYELNQAKKVKVNGH